jgi:electron transfer flavoprotein beta subunit
VAGAQTVLANHCAEFINSTQARTGSIKDNPIHRDMLFAAKAAKLAFIVNVVIDEDKQIVKAFAGDCEQAHKTGCDFLREQVMVKVPQADIVITSNGGYPLDQNIYQAVKGMTAAEASIKDGGVIIMVAACNDGHGGQSFYDNMAQAKSPAELLKKIAQIPRHKTIPDQWEFQILARILDRCRVIMVTDMCPPEMIRAMHMEHASTINEALNKAFKIKGPDARVAVITDGVSVIVDKAEEQLREDRMNITVCIKQVPGTSEVEVDEKTGVLKRDGIDSKMNPFDLFAIESALRIKEKNNAKINIISMGPPQTKEIIKEAFMMGADSGTLLSDRRFAGADVLATAYTLAQGIQKSGHTDLIICGKQTTDGDTAQVGPEIAEFLDIPHVTNVREIIDIGTCDITLEMDLPHSVEVVKVKYPCLITVEKDINQPRLPSFKLKLATASKDISVYGLDDFSDNNENNYGLSGSPTQVRKIFPPDSNTTHEQWEGSGEELGAKLFERLNQMKFIEEGQ